MSSPYDGSSQGLHSLATIIKRLEAATSRLEDIALASAGTAPLRKELDAVNATDTRQSISSVVKEDPRSVKAFDEVILRAKLEPFAKLSEKIGDVVWDQAQVVVKLFCDLRNVILTSSACAKPSDANLPVILKPLIDGLGTITKLKDENRSGKNRDWFNHLSVVADGAPAVGWVAVTGKPAGVVSEAKDAAQFYANRVIKDHKEKNPNQVEWVQSFTALLEELRKYVTEYHATGLTWNPKGGDALKWKASSPSPNAAATPSAPSGAPPPPPPPPPPPVIADASAITPAAPATGAAAVFADLNKGEAVTAGLRKVKPEQQTHKNTNLRVTGTVPASSGAHSPLTSPGKKPLKPSKPTALAGKKPAKLALEGNKWVVEYQENNSNLVIDETGKDQSISLYGCKNVTVHVKGKVNAVTMANCVKTSVLVESVISAISVTSSPSFAIQITGKAPTIQVDSTDSGQIYLSKDCLGVEIMTAKCSSINVSLPVEGEEEGIFVERAIPEMLRTVVMDGKLVTKFVEHSG